MRIDPLDQKLEGWRILTDKGIAQALDLELIKVFPAFDHRKDAARIQPATIDLVFKDIYDSFPLTHDEPFGSGHHLLLPHHNHEVVLTEHYSFAPHHPEFPTRKPLWPSIEARSSLRRLGVYVPTQGRFFFDSPKGSSIEMNNYSGNAIALKEGEKVAQMFVGVDPFKDDLRDWDGVNDHLLETIRTLDMGLILGEDRHIEHLIKEGHLNITPPTDIYKSFVLVHASDKAYRFKHLPDGIDFADRKKYTEQDLLEPVDMTRGIAIKPGEHVIIETKESFKLSPHVGIRFWDNHVNKMMDLMERLYEQPTNDALMDDFKAFIIDDYGLFIQTDGWVDPGYEGSFSRQPKWNTTQHIKPGDVIGMGQVFYFPTGVRTAYGDAKLGSQYQRAEKTRFSSRR